MVDFPYLADSEQTKKDRERFEAAGSPITTTPIHFDPARLAKTWRVLLDIQNGESFDDYTFVDDNKIERYFKALPPPPAKVLFLGTGSGREVYGALKYGYEAYGTTLGQANLPFAKINFGIDLEYVDNCTMRYPSKSFDIVAGFQIFEHCHSPLIFLFECARVLKENGYFILEWPPGLSPESKPTLSEGADHVGTEDNLHHVCCWTPFQAYSMVKRSGFADVRLFYGSILSGEVGKDDPEFYSNITPNGGDVILTARRRPDGLLPHYVRKSIY